MLCGPKEVSFEPTLLMLAEFLTDYVFMVHIWNCDVELEEGFGEEEVKSRHL